MFFKDPQHERFYLEYLALSQAGQDREYHSLCYLLAAIDKPLGKFIKACSINIKAIQAASKTWSSGEKSLVKLGINIFTDGGFPAKTNEIFRSLDSDNVKAALEGLTIRYS